MVSKTILVLIAIIFISLFGLWGLQSYTPYQTNCSPHSILGFNVEGVLTRENNSDVVEPYNRTWDSFDLAIPLETDRLFIATNIAIRDQSFGSCPEDDNEKDVKFCDSDDDCTKWEKSPNGFNTGHCTKTNAIKEKNTCEIRAWCPATPPVYPLAEVGPLFDPEVKDFVLKLENEILFPDCDGIPSKVSLDAHGQSDKDKNCIYDEKNYPNCPNIRIGDIIKGAGADVPATTIFGAIFSLTIKWDCNFDDDLDECRPQYIFKQLSEAEKFVRHNSVNLHAGGRERTLTDYIGIKINIKVEGTFTITNYTYFVFTLIAAIILFLFLFGAILGISYYAFYEWIHGNRQRNLPVGVQNHNWRVEEQPSVQVKQ